MPNRLSIKSPISVAINEEIVYCQELFVMTFTQEKMECQIVWCNTNRLAGAAFFRKLAKCPYIATDFFSKKNNLLCSKTHELRNHPSPVF
jgi:hypothetical protein